MTITKHDDFGSILPEYSAVIFDEAHEIEDVASDYFGRQVWGLDSYRGLSPLYSVVQ